MMLSDRRGRLKGGARGTRGYTRAARAKGLAIGPHPNTVTDPGPERMVPIVVGAHLLAELGDRPSAYRVRDRLAGLMSAGLVPVVVTDVWYLNSDELRARPTVSVGAPERNALTAHLADRVPSAFVADDRYIVQLDVELADLTACCWGVDDAGTARAVEVFCEKHAERWVRAVVERVRAA